MAIVAILQLISLSLGKYYLIQIDDEDPAKPELKITQTTTLPTDTLNYYNSGQHGVNYNRTDIAGCWGKCACVSDPDKRIPQMDDSIISRSSGGWNCCYRTWVEGFYCCFWHEYWCHNWWLK